MLPYNFDDWNVSNSIRAGSWVGDKLSKGLWFWNWILKAGQVRGLWLKVHQLMGWTWGWSAIRLLTPPAMPKPKVLMDCHALNYQEFDFHNRDVNGLWTHNIEEWYNAHLNHHSQECSSVQITRVRIQLLFKAFLQTLYYIEVSSLVNKKNAGMQHNPGPGSWGLHGPLGPSPFTPDSD